MRILVLSNSFVGLLSFRKEVLIKNLKFLLYDE